MVRERQRHREHNSCTYVHCAYTWPHAHVAHVHVATRICSCMYTWLHFAPVTSLAFLCLDEGHTFWLSQPHPLMQTFYLMLGRDHCYRPTSDLPSPSDVHATFL